MLNFCDRCTQLRQPRFLLQEAIYFALGCAKFVLGKTDFISATRWDVNARGIFRINAKSYHRLGQPPHRVDDNKIETQQEKQSDHTGDKRGEAQRANGISHYFCSDRVLIGNNENRQALQERCLGVDADDAPFRRGQTAQHVAHLGDKVGDAGIVDRLDWGRLFVPD